MTLAPNSLIEKTNSHLNPQKSSYISLHTLFQFFPTKESYRLFAVSI